ncbi:3-hydroxyacyl-[acyl-carrier-protein] dehydratase FabZ [Candidatus Woesearchaeota archaeon]|nr:3-hydroxyacyl-[acyl-carrier-protein] dehydratase FabZ [Candidatus Woesearchaeota archaeon]
MSQFSEFMNDRGEIDSEGIMQIIPYNKFFLLIDKVTKLTPNNIIAVKQLTGEEYFLKGHFVGFPIMPGALTVEGMGQAATLLARSNIPNHHEKDVLAYKLKEVKFSVPILPGDEVRYEINLIAQDERGAILQGKVFVKEALVAEALIMLAIVNKAEFRAKFSR